MISKEQILELIKNPEIEEESDHPPIYYVSALEDYLTGIKEWTEENIKDDLKKDVSYGFYKALNKRGISASIQYDLVRMWLWILEDPLKDFDEYTYYGLPLFKAVAVKYGFDNPIGEDNGNEPWYGDDE